MVLMLGFSDLKLLRVYRYHMRNVLPVITAVVIAASGFYYSLHQIHNKIMNKMDFVEEEISQLRQAVVKEFDLLKIRRSQSTRGVQTTPEIETIEVAIDVGDPRLHDDEVDDLVIDSQRRGSADSGELSRTQEINYPNGLHAIVERPDSLDDSCLSESPTNCTGIPRSAFERVALALMGRNQTDYSS